MCQTCSSQTPAGLINRRWIYPHSFYIDFIFICSHSSIILGKTQVGFLILWHSESRSELSQGAAVLLDLISGWEGGGGGWGSGGRGCWSLLHTCFFFLIHKQQKLKWNKNNNVFTCPFLPTSKQHGPLFVCSFKVRQARTRFRCVFLDQTTRVFLLTETFNFCGESDHCTNHFRALCASGIQEMDNACKVWQDGICFGSMLVWEVIIQPL